MGNIRHDCTTDGCFREQLWDWAFLNDCFGRSTIRVGDLDGIVERHGHFLILDGKHLGRTQCRAVSEGQGRLYKRLAVAGGTVLVFHGTPPDEVKWLRQWLPPVGTSLKARFVPERSCTTDQLRSLVADWYALADRRAAS